jgi:hypothetical protein
MNIRYIITKYFSNFHIGNVFFDEVEEKNIFIKINFLMNYKKHNFFGKIGFFEVFFKTIIFNSLITEKLSMERKNASRVKIWRDKTE